MASGNHLIVKISMQIFTYSCLDGRFQSADQNLRTEPEQAKVQLIA